MQTSFGMGTGLLTDEARVIVTLFEMVGDETGSVLEIGGSRAGRQAQDTLDVSSHSVAGVCPTPAHGM